MKTKLRSLVAAATFLMSITLVAQEYTAGINTENPNPNAVLHLVAPNGDQGLLIPSLTTAQRNAMSSSLAVADNGLMVFDSDDNAFYFWVNSNWIVTTNTDNQNISLAGTNLTIDNGNTIDLSGINTDNQNLILTGTNLSLDRGNTIDLTTAGFLVTESDPTVPANIKDGVDYTELTGIPANIDEDFTDDLTITSVPAVGDITGDFQSGLNIDIGVVSALEITDGTIADADISGSANIAASKLDPNVMVQSENVSLLNNDAGYITSESQDISTNASPGNISITGGSTIAISVDDADSDPTNEIQDALGVAYDNTGDLVITTANVEAALKELDGAVAAGDPDSDPTNEIQDALGVAYDNTGDLVITTANVEAALKELDGAVAAGDPDSDPTNEIQDALGVAYDNTGDLVITTANVEAALKELDGAVAAGDPDSDPTNEIQDALGVAYDNTGDLVITTANVEAALKELDGAVAAGDPDSDPTNEIQDALGVAYDNTGDLVITTLNVEAALKELDGAVAAGDPDSDPTNEIQDALGVAYDNTGDLVITTLNVEAALKELDGAVAAGDPDSDPTNEIQDALGVAYDNTGDLVITTANVEAALKELDGAVAAGDPDSDPTNEIQDALGVAYDNTGDLVITTANVEAALKELDGAVAAGDPDSDPTNEIQDALGVAYDNTGDLVITTANVEAALKELDGAVAAGDPDSDPTNEIQDALGVAYDNTGDLVITTANVEAALKELDGAVAAGDPDSDPTNEIQDALGVAYDNTGDLVITTLNVEAALKELDGAVNAATLNSGNGVTINTNNIDLGGTLLTPATITTGAGSNDLVVNGAGVLDVDAVSDFSANASFSSIDVTGGAIAGVNLTQTDNVFSLQDDGDGSKQATFELSAIAPATSRQYILPDQNGTIALLADIAPSDFIIDGNENNIGGNSLSTPTGSNNLVLGFNSGPGITTGSDNIILGTAANNTIGTTGGNIAIGNTADANGGDAIAIGTNTSADAVNSVAIGNATEANIPNTIVLGDGINSDFFVGIGVQDVRAPLQIGGELSMGHFENSTETILGDAIMSNLYPDYSVPTVNQLRRTNSDSASFIFFDDGEILFMNVVNGAPDSQLDLSDSGTDVRSWMGMRNDGNIDISEGIRLGSPDPGEEEDGMLRFNGSGFEGYFAGGWNPLGGGFALPYNPGPFGDAGDLFFLEQTGGGGAGRFQVNNGTSTVNALSVESNGTTGSRAMHVINSGGGDAGEFTISGGGNGAAIQANTDGTGVAGSFAITNASNASNSVAITTSGVGGALSATVNNASSTGSAIFTSTIGTGSALNVNHSGTAGNGIRIDMNTSSSNAAIEVVNSNGPSIITDGVVGIGTVSPGVSLDVQGTDAIHIPEGNTAERPGTPTNGMLRYNVDNNEYEGYAAGAWNPLGFSLPYTASLANGAPLLSLDQTGAGNVGLFTVTNPGHNGPVLEVRSNGDGATSYLARFDRNAGSTGSGVFFDMNGVNNPAIMIDNTTAPIQIFDGAVNGYVLTSDGSGIGTWQPGFGTRDATLFNLYTQMAGTGGSLSTGADNILLGRTVGNSVDTGNDNILLGNQVTTGLASGGGNISIGLQSGGGTLVDGSDNIFIGTRAILAVGPSNSSNNISIGTDATTTQSAIAIGQNASASAPGSVAIGNGANATSLNTVTLGDPVGTAYSLELTGSLISSVTGPVNDGFTPTSRIIRVAPGANINTIAGGTDGQEIILVTSGAADFGEAGNIDLTTTGFSPIGANSTLHLVLIGGSWVEISRTSK